MSTETIPKPPPVEATTNGQASLEAPANTIPSTALPAADTNHGSDAKSEPDSKITRFLRAKPRLRTATLIALLLVLLVSVAGIGYLCWFLWLPALWNWGFDPVTWRAVFSVAGAIYLVMIPLVPLIYGIEPIGDVLELYVEEQERAVKKTLTKLDASQTLTEETLALTDKTGLIPLVRYSRLQLEAYYTIGLGQTQRSFRYSILAMWIGFLTIIGGLVLYAAPSIVGAAGVRPEVQFLTTASGVIIEIISALFLWVYRSSVAQLTYFYNRQMYMHSVLLCVQISSSMADADETKRHIIENILDQPWQGAARMGFRKRSGKSPMKPPAPVPVAG